MRQHGGDGVDVVGQGGEAGLEGGCYDVGDEAARHDVEALLGKDGSNEENLVQSATLVSLGWCKVKQGT